MIKNWGKNNSKGFKTGAKATDLSNVFDALGYSFFLVKPSAYGCNDLPLNL